MEIKRFCDAVLSKFNNKNASKSGFSYGIIIFVILYWIIPTFALVLINDIDNGEATNKIDMVSPTTHYGKKMNNSSRELPFSMTVGCLG